MSEPARVGIFGGTFDPPHFGHLVVAVNAAHCLGLERVSLMVANQPWQKIGSRQISPAGDRLAMVRAAVAGRTDLLADDTELILGGDSVTATTLALLRQTEPQTEYVVIIGSDTARTLDTWRDADDLRARAHFAVIDRPGNAGVEPPVGFSFERVPCPAMDISSSELRERSRAGLPIDFMVPDAVRDYVTNQGLYR